MASYYRKLRLSAQVIGTLVPRYERGELGQGRVRAARAGQRNHLFRLQPDRRVLGAPALTTRAGRVGDGGHVRLHGITVVSHLLRRVAGSKRSHRTPLVFSRSQNAARLMAGEGRIELFGGYDSNGRSRRISPVPVRPGEGPLTERTACVQATRREQVFMPRTCRSSPLRRTSGRLSPARAGVHRHYMSDSRRRGTAGVGRPEAAIAVKARQALKSRLRLPTASTTP